MNALSKLTNLRDLKIQIVDPDSYRWRTNMFYCEEDEEGNDQTGKSDPYGAKAIKISDLTMANVLCKLKALRSFNLDLGLLPLGNTRNLSWFVDALKALSNLEELKKVDIKVPSTKFPSRGERKICEALINLKNVISVSLEPHLKPRRRILASDLENTIHNINQDQSLRYDLMF